MPYRVGWLKVVLLVLLLSLSACDTSPLAYDRTQRQANEIVAVLNANGITALSEREGSGRGKYRVSVNADQYTPAVAILHDKGLLRESEFDSLVQERGFLPNSRELEALRVDRARAVEIEEMLQNHPAILSSKVVVRQDYPSNNPQPSVAVIITVRAGYTLSREEIKSIITRVVPGIRDENVAIQIPDTGSLGNVFTVEGANNQGGRVVRIPLVGFLFGWRIAQDDYNGLALTFLCFLGLVGLLAALLGYSYGAYRRSEPDLSSTLPEPAVRSGRIDRVVKNIAEE